MIETEIETKGKSSPPNNSSGFSMFVTGPAIIPKTRSNKIEGILNFQDNH
ncbi:hypothetical protein BMS3Abin04_02796 [bacterium BMS3Abin04]|nr:hypothetical protein BMS3Abin04_02796 [bacterium BMS3Abin04]